MHNYVFVGRPVEEVRSEAACRGIHIETVLETTAQKKSTKKGIPYVIQERWIDTHTIALISGLRMIGEQEVL